MRKHGSTVVLSLIVGAIGIGSSHAEMNGTLPETPKNQALPVAGAAQKDVQGLPKLEVEFQSGHSDIPPSYNSNMSEFGAYLKNNPGSTATIIAFADHTGIAPKNSALSQKRADAVQAYLISNFGISADRISAKGYGEVTDKIRNLTESAKQSNRRAFGTITPAKS